MTFTLIVLLLTVVMGPTNAPSSIVRTAQQTPGYITVAACEADAATRQVAKIPGAVFWMCMGTASGADQWLISNWLRIPTTELPIIQSAVVVVPPPTFFMLLTLAYPVPISLRMSGFPTLDACNAVRQQLNIMPTDAVPITLSACQSAPGGSPPPPGGGQDLLIWTACPPHHTPGFLRVSSCQPECDPGYHNTVAYTRSTPCPPLMP